MTIKHPTPAEQTAAREWCREILRRAGVSRQEVVLLYRAPSDGVAVDAVAPIFIGVFTDYQAAERFSHVFADSTGKTYTWIFEGHEVRQ
jgi:hypothetical protein